VTDYTLLGRRWPQVETAEFSPVLLYLKGQPYDTFETSDEKLSNKNSLLPTLKQIAQQIQVVNGADQRYDRWHQRFSDACSALGAQQPLTLRTLWRLVSGWGTNPTLEIGIDLHPLLGFPYVPGSAVKGLLHHYAEMQLLQEPDAGADSESSQELSAIPNVEPGELPAEPPSQLLRSLQRALEIRALFGSLSARRDTTNQGDQPEAPFDRLGGWQQKVETAWPEGANRPEAWEQAVEDLELLCAGPPTGGLVTCYDAVPAVRAFTGDDNILEPDALTPHTGDSPIPLTFLAVRAGVDFELRFRIGSLPAGEGPTGETPRDGADEDEIWRHRVFNGQDAKVLAVKVRSWLAAALAENGLGAKTSAGYGYLVDPRQDYGPPEKLAEEPLGVGNDEGKATDLTEAERFARKWLPETVDPQQVSNALDKAIKIGTPEELGALGSRFEALFLDTVKKWRGRPKNKTIQARLKALGLLPPDQGSIE
jgi:CRISPR type III-B/RAMP module RAMP protein Cmr6